MANFLRVPRQVMESLAADITAAGMKKTLNEYDKLLMQEPAIVAAYLNPQIQKPTEAAELAGVNALIRELLQSRYSGQMIVHPLGRQESGDLLFAALLEQAQAAGLPRDEVDEYLSICAVNANGFNVLSWWSARKTSLPGQYQMAIAFFGSLATSTPLERGSSAAGREYTSRWAEPVPIVFGLHPDNVLTFMDGRRHPDAAGESGVGCG
jgi:hAT family C-terminal dimerisation region